MSYGVNTLQVRSSALPFSVSEINRFGSTIVFAPHPDDESLGCGGMIAVLHSMGNPVFVVFVSDGSMSHPGSIKFPADVLSALRAREALEALSYLQVPASQTVFMGLKDGSVPNVGEPGFEKAVETIRGYLEMIEPGTIILPWRRDTHADHRACWSLVKDALRTANKKILQLEYPLWLWERGLADDLPRHYEVKIRSVDISRWLAVKQKAIAAHQSQVTRMIDDDPGGFWLSPEMLAHFRGPEEIFFISRHE
ncbi:MAG: PIG-L deacetylase family protein [Chitinophagaceae bacterium]